MQLLLGAVVALLCMPPTVSSSATPALVVGNSNCKTVVTLLGTAAGPGAKRDRAGISTLLTVNGHNYLIDAGAGSDRQLAQIGIQELNVDAVFLTHLHDDHTAGLPEWMTFAYTKALDGRSKPIGIYGPPQTSAYVRAADSLLEINGEIRRAEQDSELHPAALFIANEFNPPLVYQDSNIKVLATENTHFHLSDKGEASRNKSYSLRFETNDGVVVYTGDTGPSSDVVRLAQGANILVSEMVTRKLRPGASEQTKLHIQGEHLSPTEVGKLASAADVKMVVLSHIGAVGDADLGEIKRYYGGPIVVGEDLMKQQLCR